MNAISIPAYTGELEGFLHPANLMQGTSKKVLIISHGFNGSIDGNSKAALLAERVTQLGFHVLRYKFTPCQKLTTQIEELQAVVDYAQEKGASDIYLLGRSMGGSASLAFTFSQPEKVRALCLWSTPGDLHETFKNALGENYDLLLAGNCVTITDEFSTVTLHDDFVRDFDNYSLFDLIHSLTSIPVLILHGNQDKVVALKQAEKMYAAAREPKKMVIIDGGDHQFIGKTQEAQGAVIQWLSEISDLQ